MKGANSVNLRTFLWGKYFTWSAKSYSLIKTGLLLLVPEKSTSKEMDCETTCILGTLCTTVLLENICRVLKIKVPLFYVKSVDITCIACYHRCKGCYQS